jgi:hypothetical protein
MSYKGTLNFNFSDLEKYQDSEIFGILPLFLDFRNSTFSTLLSLEPKNKTYTHTHGDPDSHPASQWSIGSHVWVYADLIRDFKRQTLLGLSYELLFS